MSGELPKSNEELPNKELPDYVKNDEMIAEMIREGIDPKKAQEMMEMMNHIINNEGLLNEVKKEMEERGEEDLKKALKEYVEKKFKEHKQTEKFFKEYKS